MKNVVRMVALFGLGIVLGCGGSNSSGTGGSAGGAAGKGGTTGTTGGAGTTGSAGTTGNAGTTGTAGTTGGGGTTGSAGTTGNAGTTGTAGTTGGGGTTGSAGTGNAGTTGTAGTTGAGGRGGAGARGGGGGSTGIAGRGGAGGGGGAGGSSGSGGQGGADCTVTGCPTGQICYSRVGGAAVISIECIANPCAPAALACSCAETTLAVCGQLCTVDGQNITCGTRCAAPDTPIATPSGEQPIATLRPGDLVFSMDRGRLVAVPIVRTTRTPAAHHHVVRVTLETGRVLLISPGHPTAEGGTFAELRAGARLGERQVVAAALVPYPHAFTYDILPESDSGTYVAAGALVGSTLTAPRED